MRLALVLVGLLLVAAPAASAESLLPPAGKVLPGVASGDSIRDFTARTGKKPAVWQHWIRWAAATSPPSSARGRAARS